MNPVTEAARSSARLQWRSARLWLALYLAGVVAITFIHHPAVLALLLGCALAASSKRRWQYLRRTVFAILAFNLTVSVGYVIASWWQGTFAADYLLLVNLRVLLLMYLGFWFVDRVSLLDALAGWHCASLLATLAIRQIKTFERILADYRAAFESRNVARPCWRSRSRHAAVQTQTLLDKSFAASSEVAQAMRSRGVFDD